MIKYVCDRCGHEVNAVVIPFTRKAIVLDGVHRREYDLCKKCFYEAQLFLQGLPTEEAEQTMKITTSPCIVRTEMKMKRNNCTLELFDDDGNYIEPVTEKGESDD